MKHRITLKEATKFHGHLGPYLVLGLLAGEAALKKLKCEKYFGLEVKVWGANKKPQSCLVDGLQLSTGATYGKGNIMRLGGERIKIECLNCNTRKKLIMTLKNNILAQLENARTHRDSEILAKRLFKKSGSQPFNLRPNT